MNVGSSEHRVDDVDQVTPFPGLCRECGAEALELFNRLEARPLGTWSLAGAQVKTSAVLWPYMRCAPDRGGCGAECRGKPDD